MTTYRVEWESGYPGDPDTHRVFQSVIIRGYFPMRELVTALNEMGKTVSIQREEGS